MIRAGFVAVVVVATFATGCGGHRPTAGTIIFQSAHSGRDLLYAVRPDGGGLTRLPLDLSPEASAVYWTRDGTKALVLSERGSGPVAVSVFEPASGTRRRIELPGLDLTGSNQAGDLTETPWSPDGKRIVLATNHGDVVLDMKTGMRWHVKDELADGLLTWSGDGKALLFPAGHSVFAAPADGGPPKRLVRFARLEPGALQASSDGKWISFLQYGRRADLYVIRTNGTGVHLLARDAESSAWSPTGERLAFADYKGVVLVDVENRRRRRLTDERLDDPANEGPAWSPDGRRILYRRNDLGSLAPAYNHMQLWTMTADGSDRHPVTHAFPVDYGDGAAVWVDANVSGGRRPPGLPLVAVRATRAFTTDLPIVSLAAEGDRAVVAQGFGGAPGLRRPSGPILVWDRLRGTSGQIPVRGCGRADDVLLAAGRVGYRCDNTGVGYFVGDAVRVGTAELVRTQGGEFTGTFLGGLAADDGTIAFAVEDAGSEVSGEFRIHRTVLWKSTANRKAIVRTFNGAATVASVDAGRIAVIRGRSSVSVLSARGRMRTFAFGRRRVRGAALDGPRLVVLQGTELTVLDLGSGRRTVSWPVRRGFGPDPALADVQGKLAAYVVGATVHVLRLSDGREIVLDTPGATEPAFARFVPSGLFYSFNQSYAIRPGRLVFVARPELERALAKRGAVEQLQGAAAR